MKTDTILASGVEALSNNIKLANDLSISDSRAVKVTDVFVDKIKTEYQAALPNVKEGESVVTPKVEEAPKEVVDITPEVVQTPPTIKEEVVAESPINNEPVSVVTPSVEEVQVPSVDVTPVAPVTPEVEVTPVVEEVKVPEPKIETEPVATTMPVEEDLMDDFKASVNKLMDVIVSEREKVKQASNKKDEINQVLKDAIEKINTIL